MASPPRMGMGLIPLPVGGQCYQRGGQICHEANVIAGIEGIGAELGRPSFEYGEEVVCAQTVVDGIECADFWS